MKIQAQRLRTIEVNQVRLAPGDYAIGDPVYLKGIDLDADNVYYCFSIDGDGLVRDTEGNIFTLETGRLAIAPADDVTLDVPLFPGFDCAEIISFDAWYDVRIFFFNQMLMPDNDRTYTTEAGIIVYYRLGEREKDWEMKGGDHRLI